MGIDLDKALALAGALEDAANAGEFERRRLELSGVWRFQADPAAQGEALGYPAPDFDVRFWREVSVPGVIDAHHPALASYEGPAWYIRDFERPESDRAIDWRVCFEAANGQARVWLNGVFIGAHRGGFLPFEIPLQGALREGRNRLAVEVDNTRRAGDVPGRKRGWRVQGGLLREVYLAETPATAIEDIAVKAGAGGVFEVRFRAIRFGREVLDVTPEISIADTEGTERFRLDGQRLKLRPGVPAETRMAGSFGGAENWSPDHPALYTVRIRLRDAGGEIRDERVVRTGFRTLTIQDGQPRLNGVPLFLKGFNRHDDSPRHGLAADPATAEEDLKKMRALGANFVRLSHYPHAPAVLDACDRLGLMAMAEIPLYWWAGETAEQTLAQASDQLRAMIRRDGHHPAVICWSVSNETDEAQPAVREGNRILIRRAREWDPTRWAAHVSDHWTEGCGDFEADDLIWVNRYPSYNGLLRDPHFDLDRAGGEWTRELTLLAARYPGKPIGVAEFGAVAWAGVRGEGLLSEDRQSAAIEAEYRSIVTAPQVFGAAIWCFADHPWPEEDFLNRVTLSPYGVVTRDRREKRACGAIRRLFDAPRGEAPLASLDNCSVIMIRPDLRDIPEAPFPPGFGIRPMTAADAGLWEDIERDAEPFFQVESGLFWREFGSDPDAISRRCFLIVAPNGCAAGTISAWYDRDFRGRDWGRIHWVAVRPAWQGKGLAKAGLAYALRELARWHESAYLVTSVGRLGAIRLYLNFGFQPDYEAPRGPEAWAHYRTLAERTASEGGRKIPP